MQPLGHRRSWTLSGRPAAAERKRNSPRKRVRGLNTFLAMVWPPQRVDRAAECEIVFACQAACTRRCLAPKSQDSFCLYSPGKFFRSPPKSAPYDQNCPLRSPGFLCLGAIMRLWRVSATPTTGRPARTSPNGIGTLPLVPSGVRTLTLFVGRKLTCGSATIVSQTPDRSGKPKRRLAGCPDRAHPFSSGSNRKSKEVCSKKKG
jgi:hypothetical protein